MKHREYEVANIKKLSWSINKTHPQQTVNQLEQLIKQMMIQKTSKEMHNRPAEWDECDVGAVQH